METMAERKKDSVTEKKLIELDNDISLKERGEDAVISPLVIVKCRYS